MYADRFTGSPRFNPGGLAAAVAINAGVVAALLLAAPYVGIRQDPEPLTTYAVPPDPVPPEPLPQPEKARSPAPAAERIETVRPIVESRITIADPIPFDPLPSLSGAGSLEGSGSGVGMAVAEPPPPAPVIVGPSVDPRFADALQPAYPPAEQRLQRDGRVTVRVLVGADGRVRQVERVSATSDAFFAATEAQALRRWRFKPGTRDGVPQEAWRTMSVTFRIEG